MRENKFRAKGIQDNKWHYGYYSECKREANIYSICVNPPDSDPMWREILIVNEVNRKTVGQYIGLKDKNRVKIYEGDIVKYFNYSNTEYEICEIQWIEKYITYVAIGDLENQYFIQQIDERRLEIIGNIYDNLDLLESGEINEM